jgi:hypothetical protein
MLSTRRGIKVEVFMNSITCLKKEETRERKASYTYLGEQGKRGSVFSTLTAIKMTPDAAYPTTEHLKEIRQP